MAALNDREGLGKSRTGLIGLVGSLVDPATGLGALSLDALLLGLEDIFIDSVAVEQLE